MSLFPERLSFGISLVVFTVGILLLVTGYATLTACSTYCYLTQLAAGVTLTAIGIALVALGSVLVVLQVRKQAGQEAGFRLTRKKLLTLGLVVVVVLGTVGAIYLLGYVSARSLRLEILEVARVTATDQNGCAVTYGITGRVAANNPLPVALTDGSVQVAIDGFSLTQSFYGLTVRDTSLGSGGDSVFTVSVFTVSPTSGFACTLGARPSGNITAIFNAKVQSALYWDRITVWASRQRTF